MAVVAQAEVVLHRHSHRAHLRVRTDPDVLVQRRNQRLDLREGGQRQVTGLLRMASETRLLVDGARVPIESGWLRCVRVCVWTVIGRGLNWEEELECSKKFQRCCWFGVWPSIGVGSKEEDGQGTSRGWGK